MAIPRAGGALTAACASQRALRCRATSRLTLRRSSGRYLHLVTKPYTLTKLIAEVDTSAIKCKMHRAPPLSANRTRTLPTPRTNWTCAARPWFPRGARSLFRCGTGPWARCQRGRSLPGLVKSGQTQARCTAAQDGKDPTKLKKDSKAKVGEKRGAGGDDVGRPPLLHCRRASFIPMSSTRPKAERLGRAAGQN
jgi:hypothetical protein